MASKLYISRGDNVTSVKPDVSKLVAVPNISLRVRQLYTNPSNSTSPTAISSNSDARTRSTPSPFLSNPTTGMVNEEITTEKVQQEYDVYARPFVPSALRSINTEKETHVVPSTPKHWVDYQAYINTFAGSGFMSSQTPHTSHNESKQGAQEVVTLTADTYLRHMDAFMNIECEAKEKEHETYALYKVPLHHVSTTDGDIWILSVPGLREDSPFIEMGDTLQVRQFWVDSAGNPVHMALPSTNHQIGFPGPPAVSYQLWTRIQYNASVYSVNRASETVYLKIERLKYLYMGHHNPAPMVVNIVFPLKYGLLGGQRRALVSMSSALSSGMHKKCQDGTLLQRNDLSDLEEPAVARNVSTGILKEVVYAPHNDWARQILFPTEADGTLQFKLRNVPHRDLFDHAINYEQAHAVNDICINAYGTLPYLISGPPGTGKTKTLVEATMQLLNTTNIAHMIICAPSEAAADTIALRLKKYLETTQLFRLNRPGRADNEVPHELMQYCHIENDMFHLPPFKTLMAFNVIVTSCRDAAILADARVTNDDLWSMERNILSAIHPEDRMPPRSLHWGALLIDEAAQATELDVLPAINVVRPPLEYPSQLPQPLFVMAGDENQLGPKTASRDPRFCTSLFSRLFDRPLFKNHPLSRSNIKPTSGPPVLKKSMLPIIQPSFTLLVRNYRSHPAILSVPSSLFYNDTLIPEAPMPSTPLQQFSLWRGRKWPVLFIPHDRPDEIEHDGGGWYNISEARMACWIAQQLVIESEVQESDICIMSPFAAQVKLLRALIRSNAYGNGRGLWKVNIGPLEAFQGLENRVVIICTTRTRDRFLKTDEERGFGIVHQKRKMNVALTRAKEALFVIGSPKVLAKDEHWRSWMAFCSRNGLVSDDGGVWKPEDKKPGKEKVGVLERALLAKEDGRKNTGKALGAGAASHDLDSEYEAWVESLREALDEEDNDTVIEDEDEGGYDGEDAADGTEECSSRNGDKQDVGSDSECQS